MILYSKFVVPNWELACIYHLGVVLYFMSSFLYWFVEIGIVLSGSIEQ